MKRSLKGDITMLFYTATIAIILLIAVPIIILIYETDFLVNKENSDFSFDERIAATGSTSGQKYRVEPVDLDNVEPIIRCEQHIVRPILEEMPACNDKSFETVTKEASKIMTFKSVRKFLRQKISANTY